MRRRSLFAFPLLATLPHSAMADPGSLPAELRVGVPPAFGHRIASRLGLPVRTVHAGLVEALNRGHLELALLDPAELLAARALMGPRLAVLPGGSGNRVLASRAVLPPALHRAMAAALRA